MKYPINGYAPGKYLHFNCPSCKQKFMGDKYARLCEPCAIRLFHEGLIETEVRALSWKEPFASLMLHDKVETRTWDTKYRGWVLICASKKAYAKNEALVISGQYQLDRMGDSLGTYQVGWPRSGHAIAIGRLANSRPMQPEDEDACFVKYSPNLYCHIYADVHAIEPFLWTGAQGWRKLTEEQKKLIKILQP